MTRTFRVADPVSSTVDAELRQRVERVLAGHYELDCEIGRGGMGIVYRALDVRLRRQVAVKLLPPELAYRPEIRTRFLREAETSAQLAHPNIVPIYTVDEREGLVFFIMGYVEGGNLAHRLNDEGTLPVHDVRQIIREVAEALAYAHARNVVHRDIKPDNILLDATSGRAMVTDFGIARAVTEGADSRLTATGMALGTPAFMSPEQAAGEREVDGRSDLYSLGIVAYQMLVGEPPFVANSTPALLVKHLSERPRPVSERRADVPEDLASTVMRLLEKDPADRFATADDLVRALDDRTVSVAPMGLVSSRTGASARSPVPEAPYQEAALTGPTAEELRRWEAPPVVTFRRKMAPYVAVNVGIIVMAILGIASLTEVTAIWTVLMAYWYAKLWTDGYDWRDVFKQKRDRLIFDVAAETIDEARAMFDHDKRAQVRERRRRIESSTSAQPVAALESGEHADTVRQAMVERDAIVRLVAAIPKRERAQIPDVVASADALASRVRELATSLDQSPSDPAIGASAVIEREITALEAQANPLDRVASEERVRRLAYLKRQRRAAAEAGQRRERDTARLESCLAALRNMRLDLVRLSTGRQSYQNVTLLAERAMSLAHDVDGIMLAADEVNQRSYQRAGRQAADGV
ncbi:MAG TPA: serine/threonine-protein kinase [Gemmatimonadaceae bacterium]|nr:serine/threonine-protein kinase [Gemmatimonadaceae bacterium]